MQCSSFNKGLYSDTSHPVQWSKGSWITTLRGGTKGEFGRNDGSQGDDRFVSRRFCTVGYRPLADGEHAIHAYVACVSARAGLT